MKKLSYRLLILSVICIAGLSGCTNDENITEQGAADFTINVQTEEFTPETETRTPVEEGYKTVFKGGEQIGITAVKNGAVYNGMDNVPFTYDAATKTWTPTDTGVLPQLYYYPNVSYIAYYPYNAGMNGKKSEQEMIDAFTPQADQSTYANYTASDLMTGTGVVSGSNGAYNISFNLQHRMSLLVVKTQGKRYVTTGGYKYSSLPYNFKLKQNESLLKVYESGIRTNRIIIPSATTPQKINISFNIDDNTEISYETTYPSLAAGKYYSINLDNGGGNSTRDLQVGDYFYTDGSIVPQDVTTPPYAKSCIGIVYKTGTGSGDNVNDYAGKLTEIHGYVLSVYYVYRNARYGPNEDAGTSKSTTDYRGYFNTGKMKAAAETHGGLANNLNGYQAAYNATITCEKSYPSPGNTSGWYLPSIGQLKDAYSNKTKIIENFSKVGVSRSLDSFIRSSSEKNAKFAWLLNDGASTSAYGKEAYWYHTYSSLTF